MGNIFSSSSSSHSPQIKKLAKNSPLYETVDFIATHYILSMDFKSMQKLHDQEYCDNLTILTSSIIDKHVGIIDIKQLSERLEGGGDPLIFMKKDVAPDFKNKQRMCNKIAKYYVKIAHLFSAIVYTINPTYTYTDSFGNEISVPLSEKDTIPDNAKITVDKLNLCGTRSAILKEKGQQIHSGDKSDVCSVHLSGKSLEKEHGIPELMDLYYDADYNYKNGKFRGMRKETAAQFNKDLTLFYQEFTGNRGDLPDSVKKFSDIKLRDYCKIPPSLRKEDYGEERLLSEYAYNLRDMLHSVNEAHKKLLEIINHVFIEVDMKTSDASDASDASGETLIKINPELNEKKLQELIERTRSVIASLYLKCERDFVRGLHIYEAVVDSRVLRSTQNQIESLEEAKQLLYI